jgi:hypothetical protein
MNSLRDEFGFIPPELIYKCDLFVKSFHQRRGSSKEFVAPSAMLSAKSPYLAGVVTKIIFLGKVLKVVIALAAVVTVLAALTSWWVLSGLVPIALAVAYFYRLLRDTLVQQRAIILAVEVLALDFAGWGSLFPKSRQTAESLFTGDWPKLIDLYLPPERRADAVKVFAPSEGSIVSAQSAV